MLLYYISCISSNDDRSGYLLLHSEVATINGLRYIHSSKWCGSFSIEKMNLRSVSGCLDLALDNGEESGDDVRLCATAFGVSIHALQRRRPDGGASLTNGVEQPSKNDGCDSDSSPSAALLSHPLRRVGCVVARAASRQVAYVTREATAVGYFPHHQQLDLRKAASSTTYKRCHVFRCQTAADAVDVEAVLSGAFFRKNGRHRRLTASFVTIPSVSDDIITITSSAALPPLARRRRCGSSATESSKSATALRTTATLPPPNLQGEEKDDETTSRSNPPNVVEQRRPKEDRLDVPPRVQPLQETPPFLRSGNGQNKVPLAVVSRHLGFVTPATCGTPLAASSTAKRQSFLAKSCRQMNSGCNVLLSRLFGSTAAISSTMTKQVPTGTNETSVRFRQQHHQSAQTSSPLMRSAASVARRPRSTPDLETPVSRSVTAARLFGVGRVAPENAVTADAKSSRKRRPVSVVFGLYRKAYASSAARIQPSSTTVTAAALDQTPKSSRPAIGGSSALAHVSDDQQALPPALVKSPPRELVFDEKLQEWIYAVDEWLLRRLEQLAYFCPAVPPPGVAVDGDNGVDCDRRTASIRHNKRAIMRLLARMRVGAFVLRVSGSRRRCLALSVRVPATHVPEGSAARRPLLVVEAEEAERVDDEEANTRKANGETEGPIAHYLIVRNERGFHIRGAKRNFSTLPMLVTHHTVLREQLPCQLVLTDWRTVIAQQ